MPRISGLRIQVMLVGGRLLAAISVVERMKKDSMVPPMKARCVLPSSPIMAKPSAWRTVLLAPSMRLICDSICQIPLSESAVRSAAWTEETQTARTARSETEGRKSAETEKRLRIMQASPGRQLFYWASRDVKRANAFGQCALGQGPAACLEGFTDHLFAFLPECFSVLWVESVGSDAFANCGDDCVIGNDGAYVAVFAVACADFVTRGNDGGPDGSCGSLGNGFPLERPFAFLGELLVDLGH